MSDGLLLWCDLKTTGTNPDQDQILEVAGIITGEDLQPIRSFEWVVKPDRDLTMCGLVAAMHARNGLLVEAYESKTHISWAEHQILKEIDAVVARDIAVTIAGATIHFDKSFLRVHMPTLHGRLHYRTFDVSTLKAAASMWIAKMPKSLDERHRAMSDTKAALELARKFRQAFAVAGDEFKGALGLPREA
jgi:oligoribonuclease